VLATAARVPRESPTRSNMGASGWCCSACRRQGRKERWVRGGLSLPYRHRSHEAPLEPLHEFLRLDAM